jgi:hypothetical protein
VKVAFTTCGLVSEPYGRSRTADFEALTPEVCRAAPIMPSFSRSLWTCLGEAGDPNWDGVKAPPFDRAVVPELPFFAPMHVTVEDVRPHLAADPVEVSG